MGREIRHSHGPIEGGHEKIMVLGKTSFQRNDGADDLAKRPSSHRERHGTRGARDSLGRVGPKLTQRNLELESIPTVGPIIQSTC